MYSSDNTQKGKNMKFFAAALATALSIVGVHLIVGWIAYNAPLLSIILIMTGLLGFALALLNDFGVIKIEMSNLLSRASR